MQSTWKSISFFWKLFAFYFRPLFIDVHNIYGIVVSIENGIILFIHIFVLYKVIKNFKNSTLDELAKAILVYGLIAGLLFVQRYSDLGLIIRTKVLILKCSLNKFSYSDLLPPKGGPCSVNGNWNNRPAILPLSFKRACIF